MPVFSNPLTYYKLNDVSTIVNKNKSSCDGMKT